MLGKGIKGGKEKWAIIEQVGEGERTPAKGRNLHVAPDHRPRGEGNMGMEGLGGVGRSGVGKGEGEMRIKGVKGNIGPLGEGDRAPAKGRDLHVAQGHRPGGWGIGSRGSGGLGEGGGVGEGNRGDDHCWTIIAAKVKARREPPCWFRWM